MKLVIAEKPSVAKDIARELRASKKELSYYVGNDYIVTWAIGHLVSLANPYEYDEKYKKWSFDHLPILPKEFKKTINSKTKVQFNVIKELILNTNVNEIICATDAGREGQLIFSYIYDMIGTNIPVKRLWISSLTSASITNGFNNLKDNREFDNLKLSAEARAETDWLYGMNYTELYSLRHGTTLRVGRVQTPTLNLIVKRDDEIKNFTPENYYELIANYDGLDTKLYINEESKFKDKEKLESLLNKVSPFGKVTKRDDITSKKNPPLLYDLTSLQRDANDIYGFTASMTLDILQRLYENKKIVTYPRTDSRYLTDDMQDVAKLITTYIKENYAEGSKFAEDNLNRGMNFKNTINNDKVSDHHAIIPTENIVNINNIELTNDENSLLKLIIVRFLVAFSEPQTLSKTSIEILNEGLVFKRNITSIVNEGFNSILKALLNSKTNSEYAEIPSSIFEGNNVRLLEKKIEEKVTTPKKYYTESSLLSVMENISKVVENEELKAYVKERGLGTPATRANIIENLIKNNYVTRKNKFLHPTELGKKLIQNVSEEIKSPELTAKMEEKLKEIEDGKLNKQDFINDVKNKITKLISSNAEKAENFNAKKESIGKCPICGADVYEAKKSYYCSNYNSEEKCPFVIWENDKFFERYGKKINLSTAKKILKNKEVTFNDLVSKKGTNYSGIFFIKNTMPRVEWGFRFPER
ncbi:DNA topoisomerase 3 [Peptoniphilus asaccharolyticus]